MHLSNQLDLSGRNLIQEVTRKLSIPLLENADRQAEGERDLGLPEGTGGGAAAKGREGTEGHPPVPRAGYAQTAGRTQAAIVRPLSTRRAVEIKRSDPVGTASTELPETHRQTADSASEQRPRPQYCAWVAQVGAAVYHIPACVLFRQEGSRSLALLSENYNFMPTFSEARNRSSRRLSRFSMNDLRTGT